jgi:hypothetical protein
MIAEQKAEEERREADRKACGKLAKKKGGWKESRLRSRDKAEAIRDKIKVKEDKLRATWAMFDAEQHIFKVERMKAYKEKRMG